MIQTESIGAKNARFRWSRAFLLFALILAGIFAAAWFWEPWYFAHEFSRDPHLAIVPQPLRITNQSKLYPVRLQAFEYSFQTPWEQAQKRKDFRTAGIIWFKGGPTVMTFDPALTSSVATGIRTEANTIKQLFGARAMSSSYNWLEVELAASPNDVHWWNRTGNVRAAVLLGLKEIEISDSTTVIYKIGNDEMHGFQFGDPAKPPYRVKLELFDVNNRRYEIMISSIKPATLPVTQADINAIVGSLRPIPHS